MAETWNRLAAANAVPEGGMIAVQWGGHEIAIYHLEGGEFHATDAICTHAYALLTDGWLEDGVVECPLHAGRFDCRTGKGLGDPIDQDLKVFRIKREGDDIMIAAD